MHLNSDIPNRAFHLVATRLGRYSWERAGRLWFDALTLVAVGPDTGFAEFARATVAAAETTAGCATWWGGPGWRSAWWSLRLPGERPAPGWCRDRGWCRGRGWRRCCGRRGRCGEVVEVTRSGGSPGGPCTPAVSTTGEDPRAAEVRALVSGSTSARCRPAAAGPVRLLVRRRARRGPGARAGPHPRPVPAGRAGARRPLSDRGSSKTRCTLCCAAWARGRITRLVDVHVRRPGDHPADRVGDVLGDQRLGDTGVDRVVLLLVTTETASENSSVFTMPGAISLTRTGWS